MFARLALIIGACTLATGLSHAMDPASAPGLSGTLPANSMGLGKGIGRGLGKGLGRGKGVSVAGVSYHCLGVARQQNQESSSFSGLADSIVMDAGGGQTATLEGTAISDLVTNGETMIPTHMAAASIETSGLTLQTFDTCGTSAGSVLNTTVVGTDLTESSTSGATYVEFKFSYDATLGGSGDDFSAYTETTLNIPGFQGASFKVSATGGKLDNVPTGLTVTDLSTEDNFLYQVKGTWTVGGVLFYGPGVSNIVQTTFQANGEVTGLNIEGSKIVAGFASAASENTLSYEIVSLDPNVSFSFISEQTNTDDDTTNTDTQ